MSDRKDETRRKRMSGLQRGVLCGLTCLAVGVLVRHLLLGLAERPLDLSPLHYQGRSAPFITSSDDVVEKMIELARLSPSDRVYDLGCGDGRLVITAALRTGCHGVGFDIDPQRVAEARKNVRLHQVGDRVRIVEQDLFTVDLSQADAVMMYLLPWMMNALLPQLEQMRPGCRIVSHEFWIDGIAADDIVRIPAADTQVETIYVYTTPLTKDPAMRPTKPPVLGDPPSAPPDAGAGAGMSRFSQPDSRGQLPSGRGVTYNDADVVGRSGPALGGATP